MLFFRFMINPESVCSIYLKSIDLLSKTVLLSTMSIRIYFATATFKSNFVPSICSSSSACLRSVN